MKNLHLGIIVNPEGTIINHRSLLKVALNPIFRSMGFQLESVYLKSINELSPEIKFSRCPKKDIKWEPYDLGDNKVIKKRMFI